MKKQKFRLVLFQSTVIHACLPFVSVSVCGSSKVVFVVNRLAAVAVFSKKKKRRRAQKNALRNVLFDIPVAQTVPKQHRPCLLSHVCLFACLLVCDVLDKRLLPQCFLCTRLCAGDCSRVCAAPAVVGVIACFIFRALFRKLSPSCLVVVGVAAAAAAAAAASALASWAGRSCWAAAA